MGPHVASIIWNPTYGTHMFFPFMANMETLWNHYGHTMDEIAFSIIFHTMEKISILWKIYGVPYAIYFHTIYALRRVVLCLTSNGVII